MRRLPLKSAFWCIVMAGLFSPLQAEDTSLDAVAKKLHELRGALQFKITGPAICHVLAFRPDNSELIFGGHDELRILNLRSGAVRDAPAGGELIHRLAFSHAANTVLTSALSTVTLRDPGSLALRRSLQTQEGRVCIDREGLRLAIADRRIAAEDQAVSIRSAATGEEADRLTFRKFSIKGLSFSPDASSIITIGRDFGSNCELRERRIVEHGLFEKTRRIKLHSKCPLMDHAWFSPDGLKALIVYNNLSLNPLEPEILDLTAATLLPLHGAGSPIDASFSLDGSRVILEPDRSDGAQIWDTRVGKRLAVLEGHAGNISAALSQDGRLAATFHLGDRSIRLWEETSSGQWIPFIHKDRLAALEAEKRRLIQGLHRKITEKAATAVKESAGDFFTAEERFKL